MADRITSLITIPVPDAYRDHFQIMADEAGTSLSTLMSSLLLSVADDDRAAHGLPAIDRTEARA